jgi:hypothetical protein
MNLTEEQKRQKIKLILTCLASGLFDDTWTGPLVLEGDKVSPDPEWVDYVFQKKHAMSIDQAVEKIFSYKPIILGPPPKD